MSTGRKPDLKIVLKPANGPGQTITLASFWTDGERPSGGLDRRIARLHVELEDGTVVEVENQKPKSHWCNLYREDGGPQRKPAPARTTTRRAPPEDLPPDDLAPPFGDDDIPF